MFAFIACTPLLSETPLGVAMSIEPRSLTKQLVPCPAESRFIGIPPGMGMLGALNDISTSPDPIKTTVSPRVPLASIFPYFANKITSLLPRNPLPRPHFRPDSSFWSRCR